MLHKLKTFFQSLSLSRRFMLGAFAILLAGTAGIGAWVEQQIVTGVIHRTGATAALYIDSFVSPVLQGLPAGGALDPQQVESLSRLLRDTPMGQQIVSFKIWDTRGRLLYSTDPSIIGKSFPMHEGLLRARLGTVSAEISTLDEEENQALSASFDRLLEIYSPVWRSGTDQVIAVAEFYQRTDELDQEIGVLQRRSWLVVGLAILLVYLLLAVFVRGASNTITHQQIELSHQVRQLTSLLDENTALNDRVRRASASVALLNENYLRRVGAELHDGPAQELGLSLLQLDALAGKLEQHPDPQVRGEIAGQVNTILGSLQNALKEVRGIAAGLSLPQLKELALDETVERVVRAHERRTGTQVALEIAPLPADVSLPLKITVYRLVQEALTNAFRHAAGAGQRVSVRAEQDTLVVEVSDQGPGIRTGGGTTEPGTRLGLSGMKERVESIGGRFTMQSRPGQGTKISARLPCQVNGESHDDE